MVAKLGLMLLVLLACALSFLAGTAAPPSLRLAVPQLLAKLAQALAGPATEAPTGAVGPVSPPGAGAGSASTASPSASPEISPVNSPATNVPLSSLLLPTLVPATGTYALQAGQFAVQQAANQLAASIGGQGVSSRVILTTDQVGAHWAVVSLGNFASPDQALAQRADLARKLGLPQYLPPITLPAPKPVP